MNIWQQIGSGIAGLGLMLGSLFGYHAPQSFGTSIYKPVPRYESSLALALDAVTTSSMTMVSGVDGNGQTLSGLMCFTLDSGVAGKVEDVCGTASGTAVSSLVRGIQTDGYTASTTLAHAHRVGADIKTTDSPYLAQYYGFLNGVNAFGAPLIYTSTSSLFISLAQQLASKAYVDSVASSGAANADEVTKGIVELATIIENTNGNATGSTGASLVPQNKYFNATSSATTTIPVTMSNGQLSPGFISTSSAYTWTGTTTLSNVARATFATATSTATSTDIFNLMPAGVMEIYASSSAPAGWLLADGTEYTTSSYPRLWTIIGYLYGGSTSTFKVPDLQGRFVAGPSSTLSTTIGATGGATSTVSGPYTLGSGTTFSTGGGGNQNNPTTGSSSLSIIPPYMILNYIIKY